MFSFFKRIFVKKKKLDKVLEKSIISSDLEKSFKDNKLNKDFLYELETSLIKADLGVKTVQSLISELEGESAKKIAGFEDLKDFIRSKILDRIKSYGAEIKVTKSPYVILFSGVNGSGKTTSIGKLALKYSKEGKKVIIAACDTFRAAAGSQLKIWADKAGAEIYMAEKENADPAAVAYKALDEAIQKKCDILLIDTAGRLQTQQNLMDQLGKIVRVIKKLDESAPHLSLLALDGTVGQNAIKQLESFKSHSDINGLVVTKLDGTTKGGVIIPLIDQFKIPVFFIGTGEGEADIQEFNPESFSKTII